VRGQKKLADCAAGKNQNPTSAGVPIAQSIVEDWKAAQAFGAVWPAKPGESPSSRPETVTVVAAKSDGAII
jgi:hypothetical protein